ncbi:hypothetical protein OS493_037755 [Desmophyllum pertusum]|uniref:Uncharacterized protein n=1 Tax=Desmophyllum pertusum TaxID=174260 RepID=A0A9W9ZWU1_9CNID|nr:hypothetical protein OS493_037755 [Desmophyllum pertusum]
MRNIQDRLFSYWFNGGNLNQSVERSTRRGKTFQIVIGLIAEKSLPQKVHTHLAAYDTFVTYELLGNGMV